MESEARTCPCGTRYLATDNHRHDVCRACSHEQTTGKQARLGPRVFHPRRATKAAVLNG